MLLPLQSLTNNLCNKHSFLEVLITCYAVRLLLILYSCRYELPQPSAAQKNDVGAWQDSVSNSCAQLEHQNER